MNRTSILGESPAVLPLLREDARQSMPSAFETDRIGPLSARIYRAKTEDSVEIAVTRLDSIERSAPRRPVVLVHGTFSQRNLWTSDKGLGFGPYLQERGYDVWVPELRGHGRSPRDRRYRHWSAEDHMQWDLPAVQRLVAEHAAGRPQWVGHSWGGSATVAALGAGWLSTSQIASIVALGANVTEGDEWMKKPLPRAGAHLILAVFGCVPRFMSSGPEPESRGYMLDFLRWKDRDRQWLGRDGRDYWGCVRAVTVPLLGFAGANDRMHPPGGCRVLFDAVGSEEKDWVLLGTQQGFSIDYGHVGMIASKAAGQEVWPRIERWLDSHAC